MKLRLTLLALIVLSSTSCGFAYRNTIGLFSSDEIQKEPFSSNAPSSPQVANLEQDQNLDATQETAKAKANLTNSEVLESTPKPKSNTGIEVIWAIPNESVEGFVLHYGYDRANLTKEIKIPASKLQRYEDPQYGFVYRHVLNGLESSQSVFVSLVAYNGSKLSAPSAVFEVGTTPTQSKKE